MLRIGIDTEGLDRGFEVAIEGAKDFISKNEGSEIFLYVLENNVEKAKEIIGDTPNLHIKEVKSSASVDVSLQEIVKDIEDNLPHLEFSMSRAIYDSLTNKIDTCIIPGHAGHLSAIARCLERELQLSSPLFPQAFAAFIPNQSNKMRLMMDLGAFLNQDLFKLAVLGEEFLRFSYKIQNPKVAFLNIGSEDGKGPPEIRDAAKKYREYNHQNANEGSNFIEPDIIYKENDVNVIVCNALNGNLVLKASEGIFHLFKNIIKLESDKAFLNKILAKGTQILLRKSLKKFSPERYNAAIVFGFSSPLIKIHGNSKKSGIFHAIEKAVEFYEPYSTFYPYFSKKSQEIFKRGNNSSQEGQN